jgi:hypothetical protein
MAFELSKIQLARVTLDVTYHATWSFSGLRGVLAERWAHGPVFGAVTDTGQAGQVNLYPAEGEEQRLTAFAGIRSSGLIAEGPWASRVEEVARPWMDDVFAVLRPQKTVGYKAEALALYPVRDPVRASTLLRSRFYHDEELATFAGRDPQHAAVEMLFVDEQPLVSLVLGVLGPPHIKGPMGGYFTFPDPERDGQWFMGLRLVYAEEDQDGLEDPVEKLMSAYARATREWERIVRTVFPSLIP